MYKIIGIIIALGMVFLSTDAIAQEVQLASYQEAAMVFIDQKVSNNVTASVVLQSTSNQEIKIPSVIENKVHNTENILAIILTNEEPCVLGVIDESCILINISRTGIEGGVIAIQDTAREVGDSMIGDFNQVFDTDATFHSTYIHTGDAMNLMLETSGVISGAGTVSAVYTMTNEDTFSMYEKISSILLHQKIKNSGGFYEVAKNLSKDENAKMSFSMIPSEGTSLYQLKLSVSYPDAAADVQKIEPLKFLNSGVISRSDIFKDGFYPLNSLIQVVLLAEPVKVVDVSGGMLPTQIVDNEKFPADLTKAGWFFDPERGESIDAKYLFGKEFVVRNSEISFSIAGIDEIIEQPPPNTEDPMVIDESLIIIIIIVVASAAAAVFFLKGYKKGP